MLSGMEDLKATFPAFITTISYIAREYHITVNPNIVSVHCGPRRLPIELLEEEKRLYPKRWELSSLIFTPTACLSSFTYPRRASGSMHMYLGSKNLTEVIINEHHRVPIQKR